MANYFEPMIIVPEEEPKKKSKPIPEIKEETASFSFSILDEGEQPSYISLEDKPKKTTTSKPKQNKNNEIVIPAEKMNGVYNESDRPLTQLETNTPYLETYGNAMKQLDTAIVELNELGGTVRGAIEEIRTNKTLKGKHKTIAEMSSALSSILGTKISAIKEQNALITKSHDLDLKRAKELKVGQELEVDDDRAIANMYEAFIKMPSGGPQHLQQFMPPTGDVLTTGAVAGIVRPTGDSSSGFDNYVNNLTPSQNRMIMEHNPNIQTVLLYNPNTGQRRFDVQDITTGQSIPNMPIPDDMFLQDTHIDVANGRASNSNIGETYKLVLVDQ